MVDLKELLEQKAAIEKQIAEAQRNARSEAVAKVRAMMAEYGLTATDLTAKTTPRTAAAGRKVAAKYRNGATGESWSGRGLQPKWLKAALASGSQLSDFNV